MAIFNLPEQKNAKSQEEPLETEEPKLLLDGLDEKNKSLYEARQIELVEERIRRMKAENDIREGRLVYISEAKQAAAAILNKVLSAYNEMVDSSTNSQEKEMLQQFYYAWIEKAQNDIKDYMQQREVANV
jgi:hypothetical protein